MNELVQIKNLIYEIRGYKVMLDSDLADLYEVPTHRLNEAVKRNITRFPVNFMFQLTKDENDFLISQFAISNEYLKSQSEISKSRRGGRRTLPYVFTEQGVAMLSSVLRSERAIQINIQIMDTFVQMRQWAIENKDLARRISELESYFIEHCKDYNKDMSRIYEAIDLLMDRTKPATIGFIKERK
ncbi:MAG: ORF6N domain-containing protein [Cyanobacteria bacterium SIG31]|nr:ORF6N domain-containing protein [Cyanobacteria bacterium SIG31]